MKRAAITILCLLGAIVLYVLGGIYAAVILFVAGAGLELIFWIRVLGRAPKESADT